MNPTENPGMSQREWSLVHDWIRLFGFTAGGWGRLNFGVLYVGGHICMFKIIAYMVAAWVIFCGAPVCIRNSAEIRAWRAFRGIAIWGLGFRIL